MESTLPWSDCRWLGPSDVKFYAHVAVDHQYRLVGLTPGLSCIAYASDGRDRKALYRAFAAASVVQARILRDAERFLIVPPPEIPPTARRFPSITRLRKWHGSTDDPTAFYTSPKQRVPRRTILIKFVREYSIELHDFCASTTHLRLRNSFWRMANHSNGVYCFRCPDYQLTWSRYQRSREGRSSSSLCESIRSSCTTSVLAPRIFAYETLSGGWRIIAMEFIAFAVQITSSPGLDTNGPRRASELK